MGGEIIDRRNAESHLRRHLRASSIPRLTVVHLIDGSEPAIETFLTAHLDRWEEAKAESGDRLEIVAQIGRVLQSARKKKLSALSRLLLPLSFVVPGLLLAAIGGGVAGVTGAALAVAGGAGVALLSDIYSYSVAKLLWHSAEKQKEALQPDWEGARRYLIQPGDVAKETSSRVLASSPSPHPSPPALQALVEGALSEIPSWQSMVIISGHGLGYHSIVGMEPGEVGRALEAAALRTGKPVDLVVLESCLMGNLETLLQLRGARYAIVSEEILQPEMVPVQEVAKEGAAFALPEQMALSLLKRAADHHIDTLTAVNLENLPLLTSGIDSLGKLLLQKIQEGKREQIQTAVNKSLKFPTERKEFIDRTLLRLVDLGDFLSHLEEQLPDRDLQEQIHQVRKGMGKVILDETHDEDRPRATGLTVSMAGETRRKLTSLLYGVSPYSPSIGPNWTAFLQAL